MSIRSFINNAVGNIMTRAMLAAGFEERHDINKECGYPNTINIDDYYTMYKRNGIGTRVVNIMPDECWQYLPSIVSPSPAFSATFSILENDLKLWHYLYRIDKLSGIGRFGILVLGVDDGKTLDKPIVTSKKLNLKYIRAYSEKQVRIQTIETDSKNVRYGLPVLYSVSFANTSDDSGATVTTSVHWTRVVHIADERESSEVYGTPRMENVWNRLLDIRKIVGSSGEMFWNGGFPGYAFESDGETEIDIPSTKEQVEKHFGGLQRYMALEGIKVRSLEQQIADPTNSFSVQISSIAIAKGIPKRIFLGSEQAQLSSVQDTRRWNGRLIKRQSEYITPLVIKNCVERLIAINVLPKAEYQITWPDINTVSDIEKAECADKWAMAVSTYIQGDVHLLIPPTQFFTILGNLPVSEVDNLLNDGEFKEEMGKIDEIENQTSTRPVKDGSSPTKTTE